MYPWASFGSFVFKRSETILFGTDRGWILTPSYVQARPVGSTKDNIVGTAIGSAARTFELYLEQDRFLQLQALMNTVQLFTDWERPVPDSRRAFLTEVTPQEKNFHQNIGGPVKPIIRVTVSLLSQ